MSFEKNVQNWLKRAFADPTAQILMKNSHLTRTQLETLLIDVLAANLASKRLIYEEKAKLRQTKATVSRGSFNRTLRQAKRNITRSIYTILLLGYFGILENASLTPFIEVSNKLKAYTKAYREALGNTRTGASEEQLQVLNMMREDLEIMLDQLSKPWISRL